MADTTSKNPSTHFWRTTEFRAILYQALVLGAVFLTGYWIFQNTLANLEKRGISSGFKYLFPPTESGFPIGETPPIPILQGGFLYFLISLALGMVAVWGMGYWIRKRGSTVGQDSRMVLATIGFLFVIPVVVLYLYSDSIESQVFDETKPYYIALITGILNTLKVSLVGCILATFLGLIIGISRLSTNWLIAKMAAVYIEIFRNIPLLLQMLFWYFTILNILPNKRQSLTFFSKSFVLNNRGFYTPEPIPQASSGEFILSVCFSFVLIFFWARHKRLRQEKTGEQLPVLYPSLAILIVIPGLVWLILGQPFVLGYPVLKGFNFQGGMVLSPEFLAVLLALVIYTAAFIAEIVRSGIQAVSKGQKEAAAAVGLRSGLVMRMVVLPQALRVIIPPQTSQYLNLTKDSSLAVAVGFPDIVSVGGTIMNQSGQAIEIIGIWMAVYLTFSLVISLFMNWYNAKVKLVER